MNESYTLKNVSRQACTMVLPSGHLELVRVISLRTGVPRNTIAALALDEYLQRHYPINLEKRPADRDQGDALKDVGEGVGCA